MKRARFSTKGLIHRLMSISNRMWISNRLSINSFSRNLKLPSNRNRSK